MKISRNAPIVDSIQWGIHGDFALLYIEFNEKRREHSATSSCGDGTHFGIFVDDVKGETHYIEITAETNSERKFLGRHEPFYSYDKWGIEIIFSGVSIRTSQNLATLYERERAA